MRHGCEQNIHRHHLGDAAAHGAAAGRGLRRGDIQPDVGVLGQHAFVEFRQRHGRRAALAGKGQHLQHFLGIAGHGDQYSHILRRHIGGVGELDVQVTAEAHVLVDAQQLVVQVLANQSRRADAENAHGTGVQDLACGSLHGGGVQQLCGVAYGADAVVLDAEDQLVDAGGFPDIGEGRCLGGLTRRFMQLAEQAFFQVLKAVEPDGFAETHPCDLADAGLLGQLADGLGEYIFHVIQKIRGHLFFGVAQVFVNVLRAYLDVGHFTSSPFRAVFTG